MQSNQTEVNQSAVLRRKTTKRPVPPTLEQIQKLSLQKLRLSYFEYVTKIKRRPDLFTRDWVQAFQNIVTAIKTHPQLPTNPHGSADFAVMRDNGGRMPFEYLVHIPEPQAHFLPLFRELMRQTTRISPLYYPDAKGNTPLMNAILANKPFSVETLMSFNIGRNQRGTIEQRTLTNLYDQTPRQIMLAMLQRGEVVDPRIINCLTDPSVIEANRLARESALSELIHASVNMRSDEFLERLKYMLAIGHDPNMNPENRFAQPPMHLLCYYQNKPGHKTAQYKVAYDLLKSYGGREDCTNSRGETPMEYARNKLKSNARYDREHERRARERDRDRRESHSSRRHRSRDRGESGSSSRDGGRDQDGFKKPFPVSRSSRYVDRPGDSVSIDSPQKKSRVSMSRPVNPVLQARLSYTSVQDYAAKMRAYTQVEDPLCQLNHEQKSAMVKFADLIEAKKYTGYVDWPTGSGKTWLAIALSKAMGAPILYVAPRTDILDQTKERLEQAYPGVKIGQYYDGKKNIDQITLTTYQSLNQLALDNVGPNAKRFALVVLDECHNSLSQLSKQHVQAYIGKALVLGLTATIEFNLQREAGADSSVMELLTHCVSSLDLVQSIQNGRLSACQTVRITPTHPGLELRNFRAQRISDTKVQKQVEAFSMMLVDLYANFINQYTGHGIRGLQGIIFAAGIAHCDHIANALNEHLQALPECAGKTVARAVHSKERQSSDYIESYRQGETLILVGGAKLREGFSDSKTAFVMLAESTDSTIKLRQSCGRALHSDNDLVLVFEFKFPHSTFTDPTFLRELGHRSLVTADGQQIGVMAPQLQQIRINGQSMQYTIGWGSTPDRVSELRVQQALAQQRQAEESALFAPQITVPATKKRVTISLADTSETVVPSVHERKKAKVVLLDAVDDEATHRAPVEALMEEAQSSSEEDWSAFASTFGARQSEAFTAINLEGGNSLSGLLYQDSPVLAGSSANAEEPGTKRSKKDEQQASADSEGQFFQMVNTTMAN